MFSQSSMRACEAQARSESSSPSIRTTTIRLSLCARVRQAHTGLRGPAIRSDRALTPTSLVHYRYGVFQDLPLRTPLGEIVGAIRRHDGTSGTGRAHPRLPPAGVGRRSTPGRRVSHEPRQSRWSWAGAISSFPFCRSPLVEPSTLLSTGRSSAAASSRGPPCVRPYAATGRMRESCFDMSTRCRASRRMRGLPGSLPVAGGGPRPVSGDGRRPRAAASRGVLGAHLDQRARHITRWAIELAQAMEYLHQRGVVHGDIKPDNVIVGPKGDIRLLDFDLTFALDEGRPPSRAGSLGYQSPQRGRRSKTPPAEQCLCFGATLLGALSGTPLQFLPDPKELAELPIETLTPFTPPELIEVVRGCLAPARAGRLASMGGVPALA